MRKFIVSDLHGNGEVYDSIISFLENICLIDEVELYINGDLIDRGMDSVRMLIDVKERIEGKGNVKIYYLGGNHELMMYQAYKEMNSRGVINHNCNWLCNGGWTVEGELDCWNREDANKLYEFVGTLDVYYKFDEKINGKPILLVHAKAPNKIEDKCNLIISDDNIEVEDSVWTRKEIYEEYLFFRGDVIGYNKLGNDNYFTIIGHTPLKDKSFSYDLEDNTLNIDGGCSLYACGDFNVDHVPLVEVTDGKLNIIIFNHNNEIVDGYYFDGNIIDMSEEELNKFRLFINHNYDNCSEYNKKLIKEILDDM